MDAPEGLSDKLHGYSTKKQPNYGFSPYKTPQDALATVLDIPIQLLIGTTLRVTNNVLGALTGLIFMSPELFFAGLVNCCVTLILVPMLALALIGELVTRTSVSIVDCISKSFETVKDNVMSC